MDIDQSLSNIKNYMRKYIDPNIVYISCNMEWIVVLQINGITNTNDCRINVYDMRFAIFRCDNVTVIDIVNKFDLTKKTNKVRGELYNGDNITYEIGKITNADTYDQDTGKIFAKGIYYFKTVDPAFYLEITKSSISSGILVQYRENGQKYQEIEYKNGKYNGKWIHWYENNQISRMIDYKDDKIDGKLTYWYRTGQISEKTNYKAGIIDGIMTKWHVNSQKSEETTYKSGKRDGLHTTWYDNNQKSKEGSYINDLKEGKWTYWYSNGRKSKEGKYKNDIIDGIWEYWDENG